MQALSFCILFVRVWTNTEPRILTYILSDQDNMQINFSMLKN